MLCFVGAKLMYVNRAVLNYCIITIRAHEALSSQTMRSRAIRRLFIALKQIVISLVAFLVNCKMHWASLAVLLIFLVFTENDYANIQDKSGEICSMRLKSHRR